MNKNRVEAFTDAVIAIIMTIMILEFKVPETYQWGAMAGDLPYLFAYIVSFLFIGVAWYNHHYMFMILRRVTKRIYWINNLWLLTMSFIPVATAWSGRFLNYRAPEYFYLVVFAVWSAAYWWLSRSIINALRREEMVDQALRIMAMPPYQFMNSWRLPAYTLIITVVIYFWPPGGLVATLCELVYMAFHTNADSDRVVK